MFSCWKSLHGTIAYLWVMFRPKTSLAPRTCNYFFLIKRTGTYLTLQANREQSTACSVFWHARSIGIFLAGNGLVAVPPSLRRYGLLFGLSCLTHMSRSLFCSAICQKGSTKSLRLLLIWYGQKTNCTVCCNCWFLGTLLCRLETWSLLYWRELRRSPTVKRKHETYSKHLSHVQAKGHEPKTCLLQQRSQNKTPVSSVFVFPVAGHRATSSGARSGEKIK